MTEQNKFSILRKTNGEVECLHLHGYLDALTAPELESSIEALIKDGKKMILVNFRNLDYISSAGLGVFMEFIEDLRKTGGDIKLTEMNPKVFSVFDLLGFPMLFDIDKEDESALRKFANGDVKGDV